jgi:ribosomal protein L18E
LKAKVNVTAHKFSDTARSGIEAQGGTISEI